MNTLLLVFLVGCSMDGRGGGGQPVEVENKGEACLLGHEPAGSLRTTFVVDQPVTVNVGQFDCLSSSCTRDQIASCEARVEGSDIVITTRASWIEDFQGACTDDCGSPNAECTTPPLPAGTYTVRLGEHRATLEVPSMVEQVLCVGRQF